MTSLRIKQITAATLTAVIVLAIGICLIPRLPLSLFAAEAQWDRFMGRAAAAPTTVSPPEVKPKPDDVKRLVFVGDILLANWMEVLFTAKDLTSGDPRYPFGATLNILQSADICAGNLESPMLMSEKSPIYSINFAGFPKRLDRVKAAGFDILTLANNHMLNRGKPGLTQTIEHVSKRGMLYTGAGLSHKEAYAPRITALDDGTRIGWLGFDTIDDKSPNAPQGPVMAAVKPDSDRHLQAVRSARRQVDLLIVMIHWGEEFVTDANAAQKKLGRQLVDAGANLVVGSHPHRVQGYEHYKNGMIIYSLGNFAFSLNDISDKFAAMTSGAIFQCDLKQGRIVNFAFIPILEFLGEPVPLHETCTDLQLLKKRRELLAILQEL